jgi:hypothetical protein
MTEINSNEEESIRIDVVTVQLGKDQDRLPLDTYHKFKAYLIKELNLDATEQYLPDMGRKSFFLLAATGLGKTVIVPLHNWLEIFKRVKHTTIYSYDNKYTPTVYVVVPTVTIAEDQVTFLNAMYDKFCKANGINSKALFGCKTVKGSTNYHAPIQFLTTGVFEAMAVNNSFQLTNHSILIDEAHKTLETSQCFEVALTNTRYRGVKVDYMSATVDTTGLQAKLGVETFIKADAIRHPIYKYNTNQSMLDSIVHVIGNCICDFNVNSPYFPRGGFMGRDFFTELTEEWKYRPSAMLAIVNCKRDTQELTEVVNQNFPGFPVLHFSSTIKRNPKLAAQFQSKIDHLTKLKQNYLVISTNVVEMGVTFNNLDWVITKDQEYINSNGDLALTPLKVNALYQRLGRVGRKGVGIGIITNDGGSYYSSLDNTELNSLVNEPIAFPCQDGGDELIAMNTLILGWQDIEVRDKLVEWNSPSQVHLSEPRIDSIIRNREILKRLGVLNSNNTVANMGTQIHQMMTYTGLSAYNCQAILASYHNKNWTEFSFQLARSVVAKYTYSDFPIVGYDVTKDTSNSIVEVYKLLSNSIVSITQSNIIGFGDYCLNVSEMVDDNIQTEYQDPQSDNQYKPLKVATKFYSDLLVLATAAFNAIARTNENPIVPIFVTHKNGKNWEVKEVNLLQYNDSYTLLPDQSWTTVQLTGKARISTDGRNFEKSEMMTELTNFNTTNLLEYEWAEAYTDKSGWVSPLNFQDLLDIKYRKGATFHVIHKLHKNYDQTEYSKLFHAFFGPVYRFQIPDLASYSPAIEEDDDDQDYYFGTQSDSECIDGKDYEGYFQDSVEYLIALDCFHNEVTTVDSSDIFQESEGYYIDLDLFHGYVTSYEAAEDYQTFDSYLEEFACFEALHVPDHYKLLLDFVSASEAELDKIIERNNLNQADKLWDTLWEYIKKYEIEHNIDFSQNSFEDFVDKSISFHKSYDEDLLIDDSQPTNYSPTISQVNTTPKVSMLDGSNLYRTLPVIHEYNLDNLKLLANHITPNSPHLEKLIYRSPNGQFELGLNWKQQLTCFSNTMDQECEIKLIGRDLHMRFDYHPEVYGLSTYIAKDIYSWFGYRDINTIHPDCIQVLYNHIGKVFYVGKNNRGEVCAWRIDSNASMPLELRSNGNLVVHGEHYQTFTIANFVAKYWS